MQVTPTPAVKVVWTDDPNAHACKRSRIDPYARRGGSDVNLAWLKKHAVGVSYRVRWWVGDGRGQEGEWREHVFTDPKTEPGRELTSRKGVTHMGRVVQLKDLRMFAAGVAATETTWEVEVTMLARTHENTGWEYNNVVWTFGHAQRVTAPIIDDRPRGL
jgi:hypothetical protein